MTPSLPAWVEKRDGRREAFDADKISQSIFAATEAVGEPNAFLARELADGVLHFLVQENDANVPTTGQIGELVEKVVRELGQPKLAEAYARRPAKKVESSNQIPRGQQHFKFSIEKTPEDVAADCLAAYSLHAVFGRDLAAAHDNELLSLSGLNHPRRLQTVVADPPRTAAPAAPWKLAWTQVRDASLQAGGTLVVDGADLLLAAHGPEWLEGFSAALEAHERGAVFHVQAAAPPGWASEMNAGPLFTAVGSAAPATFMSADDLASLLDAVGRDRRHGLRIAWHLQPRSIDEPVVQQSLEPVLARTDILPKLVFVFDRHRQNVRLHVGVDRKHPAVLLRIHLLLNNFLQLPEIAGDATRLLAKLPSLLRMAVSAGVQKRNYLRRHSPELTRGFLLERARLIVAPMLDVVGVVTGAIPAQSKLALDFARQILQTLREAADREGRTAGLDVVLADNGGVSMTEFVLTNADIAAQQSAASALLEIVHDGCFRVSGRQLTSEAMWQYVRWAAKTAHIPRIRFISLSDQQRKAPC